MKKDQMQLTYDQARDLKWFCKNVVGVRQDFYEVSEKANSFDDRLKRLEKTCHLIEKYLGEKIEAFKTDWTDKTGTGNVCKNCGDEIPLDHAQVGGVHMTCEHQYVNEKNQRMIKMRPNKDYPFCVVTPVEAAQLVKDLDPQEDGYWIESVMMSKAEVNALEDFTGW
jgi:hypothetical protein